MRPDRPIKRAEIVALRRLYQHALYARLRPAPIFGRRLTGPRR